MPISTRYPIRVLSSLSWLRNFLSGALSLYPTREVSGGKLKLF